MSKAKKKGQQAHSIPQAQPQSTSEDAPKQQKPKKMSKREKREKKVAEIQRTMREVVKQARRDLAQEKRAAKAQRKLCDLTTEERHDIAKEERAAKAQRQALRLQKLESMTEELNEAQLKELKNLRARLAPTACALDLQSQSRSSALRAAPNRDVSERANDGDCEGGFEGDELLWATQESHRQTASGGMNSHQRQSQDLSMSRGTSDHGDNMSMIQVAARIPTHGLSDASPSSPPYLDGKLAVVDNNMTSARLGRHPGMPEPGSYYTIDCQGPSRFALKEKLSEPQANTHGLSGAEKAVPRTMVEVEQEMAQIKKRLRELEEEELAEAGGMEVDV